MVWTTGLGICMIAAGGAFLLIAGVSHLAAKNHSRPQPARPHEFRINGPITIRTERGSEELHCDAGWKVTVLQEGVADEPIARRNVRQESDTSLFNWPEPTDSIRSTPDPMYEDSTSRSYPSSGGSSYDGGGSNDSGSSSSDSGSSGGWD